MYGTTPELMRRRGDDDGDRLFASPESSATPTMADYTYPPYSEMPFTAMKRRKRLQGGGSGNDLVKFVMKAFLASPIVVLVIWSVVALVFSHKHAAASSNSMNVNMRKASSARQLPAAMQQQQQQLPQQQMPFYNNNNNNNNNSNSGMNTRNSSNRNNNNSSNNGGRHFLRQAQQKLVSFTNPQYQRMVVASQQQQQQQLPYTNDNANVNMNNNVNTMNSNNAYMTPQQLMASNAAYQMPLAQQQPMPGMPGLIVDYDNNNNAQQQEQQQQQYQMPPATFPPQQYKPAFMYQMSANGGAGSNSDGAVVANAPPQQHIVKYDRSSHTVSHENRQQLVQLQNGDFAIVDEAAIQQSQMQQPPQQQTAMNENAQPMGQSNSYVNNVDNVNNANGQMMDAPPQQMTGNRVYYYDPNEAQGESGLQMPRTIYDSQGNPIPIESLQGANVVMQTPMQQAAQPSGASDSNVDSNGDNNNNSNNIRNLVEGTPQQISMPKAPNEWTESTVQQKNALIVCTVAVMALLVGAFSARRLRSRSVLSACIENESLEDELAYDEAYTTQHSTADSYNTFGTNTPAAWNGDLEKFDV